MQVRYWDIRQSGCLHCSDQHDTHRCAIWTVEQVTSRVARPTQKLMLPSQKGYRGSRRRRHSFVPVRGCARWVRDSSESYTRWPALANSGNRLPRASMGVRHVQVPLHCLMHVSLAILA